MSSSHDVDRFREVVTFRGRIRSKPFEGMAPSLATTFVRTANPDWELTVVRNDDVPTRHPALGDLGEADLVRPCRSGQAGALDVIVERHRRTVYQLCYRFVGNHEDASDLSQDVFLRAFRGLRNFKGESSLGTWLYRIGVNVCLNRVSAKTPVNEPIEKHQYVDDHTESPSDRVLRGERAMQVRSAIMQLPRKQRAALILRMY